MCIYMYICMHRCPRYHTIYNNKPIERSFEYVNTCFEVHIRIPSCLSAFVPVSLSDSLCTSRAGGSTVTKHVRCLWDFDDQGKTIPSHYMNRLTGAGKHFFLC